MPDLVKSFKDFIYRHPPLIDELNVVFRSACENRHLVVLVVVVVDIDMQDLVLLVLNDDGVVDPREEEEVK